MYPPGSGLDKLGVPVNLVINVRADVENFFTNYATISFSVTLFLGVYVLTHLRYINLFINAATNQEIVINTKGCKRMIT